MKRSVIIFMVFLFCSCSTMPEHFIRMDYGASIAFEEILKRIENERVIFVGEIHTQPSSHRVQLEIIKHLTALGKEVTIAVEIFPASQQASLDEWVSGTITRDDFTKVFKTTVNLPFGAYEGIFEFARQNEIPMVGIDAVRKAIAHVSKNGTDEAPAEFLEKVKYSECNEDPQYMYLLGFSGARHYHQSGMPFLCEAQRLRDAVMAYNVSRVLQKNNSTVVVMVGLVHAAKVAVPNMLQQHVAVDYVVLMPEEIKTITNKNPALDIADFIWY